MEFDNSFEVPLGADDAFAVLTDIPRIAGCVPGAALTEVVDARTYKGRIAVRLGPVALSFAGTVTLEEIDPHGRTARLTAKGSDAKGRGAAAAAAGFRLETAAAGTRVLIHTTLALSGALAQYGRGVGVIQMTAAQIVAQFAGNLSAQLAREGGVRPESGVRPKKGVRENGQREDGPGQEAGNAGAASPAAPPEALGAPSPPPLPEAPPVAGLALLAQVVLALVRRLVRPRAGSHE